MLEKITLRKAPGPLLLFLHGFLGSLEDWKHVVEHLPAHCIAIDLPGHGNSPFTPDFLSAFLQATESLPPFHLIGYSMGGRLGLQFAAKYPEKIVSLTLLSAHPGLKTNEERLVRLEKDKKLAQEIIDLGIDQVLQYWYDQPLFQTLKAKMDIRALRSKQNIEGLSQAMADFSLGHQEDLSRLLENATLAAGEYDPTYRAHYAPFPHTIIPDAGHAVHLENPQAVAQVIQNGLQKDKI